MSIYHNIGYDDACDILVERKHRIGSQIIAQNWDMEFESVSPIENTAQKNIGVRILGQHLEVASATRNKLIRDIGFQDCADSLPQSMLIEALNHVMANRLRKVGSVKVWHDSEGRLINLDWGYQQQAHMDSVSAFQSAFHTISMKNQHTIRRPMVSVLVDQSTHIDVTTDCNKVREVMPYDTVLGGVMLRHSETGTTPTMLYASIFRSFCRNQFRAGFSKKDPRYLGDMHIPVGLNDIANGLACGLGSLLNSMHRLVKQPCIDINEVIPLVQHRWNLSQVTADKMQGMTNFEYVGTQSRPFWVSSFDELRPDHHIEWQENTDYSFQYSLYDVLNNFTAVTTHQRGRIPASDCNVLERLSDSLLMDNSPLQRLLQQDLCVNKK